MTVYNVNVEKYFCYKSNVYLIIPYLWPVAMCNVTQSFQIVCKHNSYGI